MKNSKIEITIKNSEDIKKINPYTRIVVIKTKPTIRLLTNILNYGTSLKTIKISKKLKKRLKDKVWKAVESVGVEVCEFEGKRGRKKKYLRMISKIKELRKKNKSIRQISKKLGVPKSSVYRIIRGI